MVKCCISGRIAALATLLWPCWCLGQGVITTVAGSGVTGFTGDGGAAISARLGGPIGITVDAGGNFYIADQINWRIRKITAAGIISTVAGNGTRGFTGDGGPATSASLNFAAGPQGLAVDSAGNLYFADGENHRVRKVTPAGIISTFAGNGAPGFAGDNGPATSAQLQYPLDVAVDSAGNVYIADKFNNRIRKVNPAGIITTVAGNGFINFTDGVPAITAGLDLPEAVAVDSAGNLYISESSDSRIRKVDAAGIITLVAGQARKTNGFSGDGGPGTSATLFGPGGLAVDRAGNLYIADTTNNRIRKVDTAGIITTFAGNGMLSFSGDGGPATNAALRQPVDVAADSAGNIYIADTSNNRVRKVAPGGPAILASPGSLSFSFTIGGAAPAAQSVAVSSSGAAFGFTAAASTVTGGNWLAVNPAGGTTPATLNVSVNPAGLSPGSYQGIISITPSGGSPQNVGVTLNISGAGTPIFSSAGVVNALGYQNKLAPDTIFVIFGTAMGPATLTSAGAPYPESLGGTSVTFTPAGGGAAITAGMIYSVAGQIAGFLPSSITPGVYAVRVTYNGLSSAPQNVTVVARSFGIATANSAGNGTAQATVANVNGGLSLTRFTSGRVSFGGFDWILTPARPGDTVVLWGTGGGADAANDTGGTSGDQTDAGNFSVNVGGRPIRPLYAGASSGYPGLWQINFTLPGDITPDCFAPVQVRAGGELSNAVTIPIAAAGQSACSDPDLSPETLARLDAGNDITFAAFAMFRVRSITANVTSEAASGGILRYTASKFALTLSRPRFGLCRVYDRTYPSGGLDPASPDAALDAGPELPLSGPGLPAGARLERLTAGPLGPSYAYLPSRSFEAGQYTLAGNGGTQVGAFNVSTNFPSSFTVTNFDTITAIDRSRALNVNWTGAAFEFVTLLVATNERIGSNLHSVTVECGPIPGASGTYSIPPGALASLTPGSATLSVQAINRTRFTAPLAGGGQTDIGVFEAHLGVEKTAPVQ